MLYTIENFYIQPTNNNNSNNNNHNNNNILLNFIPSQPSIIYLQTPILSYTYSQPYQTKYILPIKTINQQTNEIKSYSNELIQKERIKSPIKRSLTPLSAEEQLDLNLSRYGYRRQLVNGDGNCFFTAIASQLITLYNQDRHFRIAIKKRLNLPENLFTNITQLARTLRKLVCLEWKINHKKYKPYINDVNYYDEIRKFRSDKFYSSILGDILPLTISNLIGVNIKIITNLSQCPLIDVCPQDEPLISTKSLSVLTLAYNQENDGHYDIAVEKTEKEF
ncbi:unnamed protein product [Rotaria sp. Silwood1]|nr:unnamed protein product [Rotaria sp. Silwood1]CAF1068661.1 unnamed protein product [Rotaria sp. Silwood1]CAF3409042.1 unnamed protein product [Rotaria sp. Silwood1]CAF4833982.1 unnamed protein product [Rotaria sp. Silwood1]